MSFTGWAVLSFGLSAALALALLYGAGPKSWYWHVLSLIVAVAIGLTPTPERYGSLPQSSIVVGVPFVFLFVWGIAAPFFLKRRRVA